MSKTILITGGNRGIGKEVAKTLLQKGNTVIITGRNDEAIAVAAQELKAHGNVFGETMDVTDDESVYDAHRRIKKKHGHLDVLINNAGIFVDQRDSTDVSISSMKKTMETNFYGPLRTSQAFLDLLYLSPKGRIINISSGMGAFSEMMGGSAAYRVSKTALNSLTAIMSTDLHGGIDVVAACPGWVRTDMGGQGAPRSLEQGARGIVDLATRESITSGRFYRDGTEISW